MTATPSTSTTTRSRSPTRELAERAARGARQLVALGVEPGDAVGLLGPNRPEWIAWAFAIWTAGAVLVPVQIPLRIRNPDAFAEQVRALVEAAGCRRAIADPRLLGVLPDGVGVAWDETGDASGDAGAAPRAGDTAVIQFTSGSTSTPKGALITHAAAMAQMDVLRHGYRYADGTPRTVLSWTPFFHDLGLFANVVHPAVAGSTTHHLPTERFARDPVEWLRLVGRTRAGRDDRPVVGVRQRAAACQAARRAGRPEPARGGLLRGRGRRSPGRRAACSRTRAASASTRTRSDRATGSPRR